MSLDEDPHWSEDLEGVKSCVCEELMILTCYVINYKTLWFSNSEIDIEMVSVRP